MSTIIEPPDSLEPPSNILHFPADDFAAPERVSPRQLARMIIVDYRQQHQANDCNGLGESEALRGDLNDVHQRQGYVESPGYVATPAQNGLETPANGIQHDGSDWAGNPREYHCSRSHLENVLAARDEALAREARRTVAQKVRR